MIFSVFVLALLKDRKLFLVLGAFLLTWQIVVPTAVSERVNMTQNADGELEASAQERASPFGRMRRSRLPAVQSWERVLQPFNYRSMSTI